MTEVLFFMTGEVLCGHVGVIFFVVVTLSVTFTGTAFRISTCISFYFFLGEISASHLFL